MIIIEDRTIIGVRCDHTHPIWTPTASFEGDGLGEAKANAIAAGWMIHNGKERLATCPKCAADQRKVRSIRQQKRGQTMATRRVANVSSDET